MEIRSATPDDAAALLEIYSPYVLNTAITFEYVAPSLETFRKRIESALPHYPFLLAADGAEILGYAYAGPLKSREAYDWSVETSIYIRLGNHRRHVGTTLYSALELELKQRGIRNMYACITAPDEDHAFVPAASPLFHERMGYRTVGHFHCCGYKFDRWFDILWMEKFIGDHNDAKP